jgi:UDP-glucose 4-epimerase
VDKATIRILITGVTGFVGRNLYEELKKNHYSVYGISRSESIDVSVKTVDLNEEDLIQFVFDGLQPDIIVHTAATLPLTYNSKDAEASAKVNKVIDTHIIRYCKKNDVRLIYFSSAYIYDRVSGETELTESDKITPEGSYLQQKFNSEQLIERELNSYTILRLSSPFGKGLRKNVVMNLFIEKALKQEPIVLEGSGERVQNFIYIKDVVYFLEAIIKQPKNGIYNLVSDTSISMKDLAETIKNAVGEETVVKHNYNNPDVLVNNRFSNRKVKQAFNIKFNFSIIEAIKDYI